MMGGTAVAQDDLISVIIPAHNVARFIGRTLESVLKQTHRALDVVVVDDGSTDDTADVVEEVSRRDPRVRLVRSDKLGVSAARNLAIAQAKAQLIAPVDADDIWHPDKLARQLAIMRAGSDRLGVVYCWSRGIDDQDRVILPSWNDSIARGDVLQDIIIRGIAGNGSTPLIRRRFIEQVGGYDAAATLSEDWKFYTALAGVCEFDVVPQYLVGYRLHEDSASMTDARRMEQAIADCTAWIKQSWPNLPSRVFVERDNLLGTYLGFLAIRQRDYRAALRYIAWSVRARPSTMFSGGVLRLLALMPLHAAGLRHYNWRLWSRPAFADMPVN
jgi:glycosyltransferase involved in cell wall biosynthesis